MEELLKKYRLTISEVDLIKKQIGREPRGVEWALYSALWSEHCSYKSSRKHLKKFAETISEGSQGGENAGQVDLGLGEKIIFKMESHNHPSFIEPFHGASTGVGGILRDIFTMGARPIALANYLCFGDDPTEKMKSLYKGVVKGISHYGNCVGVPTIQGQTHFHPKYQKNILVNAMAIGLIEEGQPLISAQPLKKKSLIVYVGSKTGRDGVHGAAMASESFGQDLKSKRPNIQIGDPYYEKLLIEACLSVAKENVIECMQDMGAAGITSSSFEMASKGEIGFNLHLDLVPQREEDMTPEEILLSESQERMLLLCEEKNLAAVKKHFGKFGLEAVSIGETDPTRTSVKIFWNKELLTDIEPKFLVDDAPMYDRPFEREVKKITTDIKRPWENSTLREWIYQQYDQRVGTRTIRGAEQSGGFVILPSGRSLGFALGCDPWLMEQDARMGAFDTFMRPFIQLTIKGSEPRGLTDCLNFGNPERPNIMAQFVDSVEEFTKLGKLFRVPVVSGNVSFYNETEGVSIPPTPAVGMVALASSVNIPKDEFQVASRVAYLLKFPFDRMMAEPEKFTLALSELREIIISSNPISAKLLSLKSWKESLLSLCKKRTLKIDSSFTENLDHQVTMYSCAFSFKDEESSKLLNEWAVKHNFSFSRLGQISHGDGLELKQSRSSYRTSKAEDAKSLQIWGLT